MTTPTDTVAARDDVPSLTKADRCDSCGANAVAVFWFATGELMMCGHHARSNADALVSKATRVYDPDGVLEGFSSAAS